MVRIDKKRYTVNERTKARQNFYHLKVACRALNSAEWYDLDEVMAELLDGKRI